MVKARPLSAMRTPVTTSEKRRSIIEEQAMSIRIDLQRIKELDSGIDYPSFGWFDAVPRLGEVVQLRDGTTHVLSPRTVVGVNYIEREPNKFGVLVVVE